MSHDRMIDQARFKSLAESFGGDLDGWPDGERQAAAALLAQQPALRAVLDDAAALDALLGASAPPVFSGVLRERILASAPGPREGWTRRVRWLGGAGLAAACAAGVLLGANMSGSLFADPGAEALMQTSTSMEMDGLAQLEFIG